MNSLSTASAADFFDSSLAIFYAFFVCTGPFFHIFYFTYNVERLQNDEDFQAKYETVFEGVKIDKLKPDSLDKKKRLDQDILSDSMIS
jgi:hypothetical protein